MKSGSGSQSATEKDPDPKTQAPSSTCRCPDAMPSAGWGGGRAQGKTAEREGDAWVGPAIKRGPHMPVRMARRIGVFQQSTFRGSLRDALIAVGDKGQRVVGFDRDDAVGTDHVKRAGGPVHRGHVCGCSQSHHRIGRRPLAAG